MGKTILTSEDENKLVELLRIHYFRSIIVFGKTYLELKAIARSELEELLEQRDAGKITVYLFSNWYSDAHWPLWGRISKSKIAFSRATMFVESHWSVLKRLYLLPYNRPRVVLVVYVI